MAGDGQGGEQVFPVVPGRFHRDQYFARRAKQAKRLLIARGVFAKRRGLDLDVTVAVDDGKQVRFGCDVDSGKAHTASCRRRKSGASEPVLTSTLVHARTRRSRPRDTVRTLSTGRGRQSHCRGRSLKRDAATLSRIPSTAILGVIR